MVRPRLAALGLIGCGLIWLVAFAWRVQFDPPALLCGLGRAAAVIRLEAIATTLYLEAAALSRARVQRLREEGAPPARRRQARFELADNLRDAGLFARADGNTALAEELIAEALRAAPERVDLRCLLVDLRTRDLPADERRVALLRLVYETDAACAHFLAGESFFAAGDTQAARAYWRRAARLRPDWPLPHLRLARLSYQEGDREATLTFARDALNGAQDLGTRLEAAALLRAAGGRAPETWRLVADYLWRTYRQAGALALAYLVFVLHPSLLAARRAVARVRGRRSIPDSAS